MKAYEIRESFGLDNLVLVERDDPEPGPHDVVVDVAATSVNYRDLLTVLGHYNPRQPLPLVPFSDGVGRVTAVGSDVTRVAIGDRVCGIFNQHWLAGPFVASLRAGTLGGPLDGMLAERVCLSEEGVVPVPEHLTDDEAATLPCAGVTAWSALFEEGRLQPGETVLVQGTGGVSIFALQFAKAAGARVIVTSSSDAKLERATRMGADETINYIAKPEWDKEAKRLTNGRGVDHVVEVGGAGTLSRSLNAVRVGGHIAVIGILSGTSHEVDVIPILMGRLRLNGIMVGSRSTFEMMAMAIQAQRLRPVIDRVFSFDDAPEALRHMQGASHFGKIVVAGPTG